MAGPNFTCRVWIAFDAPSSTSPTWVEITGYVQQDNPITIAHGRSDGLSDVNASTCTLTVDNSDGRFSPANPSGAWYRQIHKSNWLKVEITPPSATVSQRFVGFITSLPNQWSGQLQYGAIAASDRFEKLQQNPAIISSIQSEVLTDPNLAPGNSTGSSVQAYWNLHEASGALTFGDTSGQAARALLATGAGGVPAGIGFAASNANAPGFDGLRAVSFNPVSVSQGTYLTAPITSPTGTWGPGNTTYTGLLGTIEFWFQAVTTGARQMLVALVDPIAQFGITLLIDASGYLGFSAAGTTPTNAANYGTGVINVLPRIDDGKWHQLLLGFAATNAGTGTITMSLALDGAKAIPGGGGNFGSGVTSGNLTQIIIGAGYDGSLNNGTISCGASNIAEVAWLWADMPVTSVHTATAPPDAASHYAAATTGFLGESTDTRIARLARYAGIPTPTTTVANALGMGTATRYAGGLGPWTNLATGAHLVGTQSMAGRKPLDVMLEAAHTEGMPLYVNRAGYLEIQASTARQNTSPAWSVNVLELDPSTQVADDFAYTTNQMTVTPNSAAAQTVIGAPGSAGRLSQAKYGVYDGSQATASVNPIEAQSLGLGIIQLRADPAPRLVPFAIEASTIELLPGYGSAWYDAVLATEISTPIRVTNAPAAVGGGNYDCLVEGWTESITAGSHMLSFNTSPAQGPTYQLDDALLGRLDTDGTTLQGALNTTATTFTAAVATATSAAWTVSAADFPFDILMDAEQMTVTSIAPVALGVDGTFESSATGWTLTGCTLVQSTAQAHSGTHSGLMTATTTGAVSAVTPQFAVNGGATYQPSHWFYLASGSPNNDSLTVSWYTSGAVLISTVLSPYVLTPQSFWRQQAFSVTAPSNAAFATIKVQFTASTGNAIYLDDATFTLLTGGQQQFTVTRSVNGVVASHTSGASLALAEPLTLAY